MWHALYSAIVVPLLWIGLQALRLANRKVRRGFRGRVASEPLLRAYVAAHPGVRRVWVHVSSLGEFEQAKPIVEALKAASPERHVVVSFFSPSGYDHARRYRGADHLTYMPFDARRAARRFVATLRPALAVFVRYDVWPNHVWACRRAGVPVVLANATLRATSPRLWPVARGFHRALYDAMDAILTVSADDAAQFARLGLRRVAPVAAGDTRYDRVRARALTARETPLLPDALVRDRTVLVAGSTWGEDEDVLIPAVLKLLRYDARAAAVIVPHEPSVDRLEQLEERVGAAVRSIRFSHLGRYAGERVVLVDGIGILLALYASAHTAFVGGGFRSNVHNTLEPAAYGIPVLYGPKIHHSQEAGQLAGAGGGVVVSGRADLYRTLRRLFADGALRAAMGARAGAFVEARAGATDRIVARLEELAEGRKPRSVNVRGTNAG